MALSGGPCTRIGSGLIAGEEPGSTQERHRGLSHQ